MSKFIKYNDVIINIDNINYVDLCSDIYGHVEIKFGKERCLQFAKTDELLQLLNSLLENTGSN